MAASPDDDREKAVLHKETQLSVSVPNERAGTVGYRESGDAPRFASYFGRSMRGDHDVGGHFCIRVIKRTLGRAQCPQAFTHDWVVDQFTENGKGSGGRQLFRLRDRVAHPKAHSEMFGENDLHGFIQLTL